VAASRASARFSTTRRASRRDRHRASSPARSGRRSHRDRFFTLLAAIARQPLRYGDDIVLSFTGERRPRIHDVGRVLYFPSGDDPAVARWLEPGFQEYRTAVYRDLVAISAAGR